VLQIVTPPPPAGGSPGPVTANDISDASNPGRDWIRSASYAAMKLLLGLVKGDVGLGAVDNTADADKPVSTAMAARSALNPTRPTRTSA
jgi:hypothetical protein